MAAMGLTLGACETVERDIRASAADTRTIFTDFTMDKLLAARPATPQDSQTLVADAAPFKATRVEMQVEEHIVTGDHKIIPVPGQRPDRQQDTDQSREDMIAANTASGPSSPACPDVRIVSDLNQVHQFNSTKPNPDDSISSIWLQDITEDCQVGSKNISIDMTLAFEGTLGPKGKAQASDKPSFAYPYFVAITNNQGNIVAKEVFAVTLTYDDDKTANTKVEKLRQVIPVASDDMRNYKILVGFQLNDAELAYNRMLPPESRLGDIAPAAGGN